MYIRTSMDNRENTHSVYLDKIINHVREFLGTREINGILNHSVDSRVLRKPCKSEIQFGVEFPPRPIRCDSYHRIAVLRSS